VRLDGFEADDVIATLAERARERSIPVVIVTGDRDAFQLIDSDGLVTVMATARGITDTKLYDRQAVVDRYGIAPELIPDFYGLKGDTSDNIPGVPGIGDKTASQLLQTYGDLEGVLASIDQISGAKRKQNLVEHAEDARISKVLATMRRDLPVDLDVVEAASRTPDRSRLRDVFREFELRDPLRRLEEVLGEDEAAPAPVASTTLTARVRPGTLAAVAGIAGDELVLAARPPEIPEGELLAVDSSWRFAVAGADEVVTGAMDDPAQLVAAAGDRAVVAYDAKALGSVPPNLVHDALLGAYLLEPARRGYPLRELLEERGLAAVGVEDPVAAEALLVGELSAWQREQIDARGLRTVMDEIELPLVPVLRRMELEGVRLNTRRLAEITSRVRDEVHTLEQEIWRLAGTEFVIGSPQQLGEVLFETLGLSRKRRGKTGFSTDARVLQAIRDEHEIIPLVERWRELNQLDKTYLSVLPQLAAADPRSRIHTTFLQAAATTGRLASTNPNMQNVPIRTALGREIRGCFDAEPGNVLLSADYSQIELRVLAHIADEPVLKEIFVRGEDVHTATASKVFQTVPEELDHGQRSKAKMMNYGIVYGLSDFGLADRLGIPREEAKEIIDTYLERFPAVRAFIERTIESAREKGHVTTLWGRRRQIPELKARNWQVRTLGERLAVNTVIQGTAADVMKLALVRVDAAVRELIRREMCAVWEHDPPLAVDIGVGPTWMEAK
jgi:DNA polymerase-1